MTITVKRLVRAAVIIAAVLALLAVGRYVLVYKVLPNYPMYYGGCVYYTPQAQQALFREHIGDFDALRDAVEGYGTEFEAWSADKLPADCPPALAEAACTLFETHHCAAIGWRPEKGVLSVYFHGTDESRTAWGDMDHFSYFFQPSAAYDLHFSDLDMGGGWYWYWVPIR